MPPPSREGYFTDTGRTPPGTIFLNAGLLAAGAGIRQPLDAVVAGRQHAQIAPLARLGIGQALVRPHIVAGHAEWAAGSGNEGIQGFGSRELHYADHVGPSHERLDRPFMAFDAEHSVLLIARPEYMDPDWIAGVRLDNWRGRIFGFVHDARLEHLAKCTTLFLPFIPG